MYYSKMEYKDLRLFVDVIREGGFSEAGRRNEVSQSAVSKAVRALEKEVGMALIQRSSRPRNRLTDAGEVVFRRGLRMLGELADLQGELDDLRGLKRGTLRLGLPRVGAGELFAGMFAEYRRRYSGIDLVLTEDGSERLLSALRVGEVELAATFVSASAEFESHLVHIEPLIALVPSRHPLAKKSVLRISDLAECPMVLFDSGFALYRMVIDAFARVGLTPKVSAQSAQVDFIIDLVEANVGVTFLPRLIADQHLHKGVRVIALEEPNLDWAIHMAWRADAHLSHAARAWLGLHQVDTVMGFPQG